MALTERPRCLVVDGHLLVRLGAESLLADSYDVEGAASRREALELVETVGGMDIALVDLRREANGDLAADDAITAMRRSEPGMGIVALGDYPHRHRATAALQAGATAFVSKTSSPDDLLDALRAALDSESWIDPAIPPRARGKLTRRQREILQLLAHGESTTIAARQLGLSEETVKTHTKNILARLEARNRAHAVAIGLREALID